ncbi:TolC family protein [Spirosoma luteum]|uniref:TolC family protein n=1 Tax=Spirosoma luteum TaxID=431553 RepID=UPI000367B0C6|nr:TolC family protein [Spirosoma luteum]
MKEAIITIIVIFCSTVVYSQQVLSLQESKELAIKNNIQIKNSELETEVAQETKKEAFTNYFPKVTATAFAFQSADKLIKLNNPGGNLPVYDGSAATIPAATQFAYLPPSATSILDRGTLGAVNVVQPVYTGGQIATGNKLALLGVEVKEQQQIITKNEILLKTEQQYWQVVSLREKKKTLDKYEQLLADLNKQVNDSYKSGLIVKNDVLKVQIRQSEVQANKNRLNNGEKLALMQFCQTIEIPYDSTLVLSDKLTTAKNPEFYFVRIENALPDRPEYKLLEKSVEAEALQTRMKKADYLPKVSVGITGFYLNAMDNGGVVNGLAFATVSVPVSNFWGLSHSLKKQRISETIEENNAIKNRQLLKLQMEKAWAELQEAFAQIKLAQKMEEQTRENLRVSTNSYTNGLVSLSDVLEAQALLREASNKVTEAQSNYQTAITTYLQVTGR